MSPGKPLHRGTAEERFASRVNPRGGLPDFSDPLIRVGPSDGECWMWIGGVNSLGYAHLRVNGRLVKAHRFSLVIAGVDIPEGWEVDHLCRRPRCVNPRHLEPVPPRVNGLRSNSIPARNARKSHCKRGHPLSGENVKVYRGGRYCLTCKQAHNRARTSRRT